MGGSTTIRVITYNSIYSDRFKGAHLYPFSLSTAPRLIAVVCFPRNRNEFAVTKMGFQNALRCALQLTEGAPGRVGTPLR